MPTPRFGLPFIAQGQAQKEVTHNDALIQLDALVDLFILDRDLATPPGSPVDGDTYLVAGSPTGAWAGQAGKLAYSVDGAWRFYSPLKGLIAYVADEQAILIYTGSSWVDWSTLLSFQNLPMLGVNTTADATNKLAAKTNAILFDALRAANGGNGDIQVKLSKEAAGDTASFLFQTNYSGRAEIGLTGDDDFHFKVSPDGSSWNEAILVNRSTGLVTLASVDINGGTIDGANIGAATAGTGRFSTLTATGAVTLSPASANVAISPTGTGAVTISPAGALTVNPAAASTINNCSIGATTPSSGQFTTLSATGAATLSPANANVTVSPTGTGTVTINPATAGNINNVAIGQTTAAAIRGTTINATSAFQVAATQVVGTRKTGWAAASGAATRTTFATSTVTLSVLAEHVKALIDDLISHGLIGT